MFIVFLRLLVLSCLFICGPTLACVENDTCIQKSSWHIGLALGLGVKTNPLVDGDDIPLVILPDVAWYAEKAYFDNGELGYQWINQTRFAFETFLQVDRERAFFSFLHPANILVPTEGLSPSKPALPDSPVVPEDVTSDEDLKITQSTLSIDDIAKRKWSVNGGIRGHYFLPDGEWQLAIQQDISNVHKGQQLVLEYSHKWLWQKFRFGLRLGTNWKSARLVDYYYGVSERDTNLSQLYFSGKSGWQTYLSANVQKPINENWSWLANIGYRKLPSSLTKSPLVEKNYVGNVFVGIAYRF